MKQKMWRILTVCCLACLILLSACGKKESVGSQEATATGENKFSCSAENAQGEAVDGFWKQEDGTWYLFVPSSWNLQDVVLCYSGEIAETENGSLNQATSTVSGAFLENGDKVVLKTKSGSAVTVVVMQSELPSVQITLKDTTLAEVHQDKDEKHPQNTVVITNSDGTVDVEALETVELKGRGNSTWQLYEKKGYQIKFREDISVLGMDEAKKWVLLSNASDDSMVRSRVSYDAAAQMNMAFVPEFEYVDLWINGEYRGTYMIGEKVEVGSSRLDLKTRLGALIERDDAFYAEEDQWVYNDYLDAHFVLKENVADEDAIAQNVLKYFSDAVDHLAAYLYTTPSDEVTMEKLSTMIDVDSFALYYLVNEYTQNREAFSTSFYWYMDGPEDVLHLGPVWDFDTCMGNDGTENTESYGNNSIIFQYLLAVPQFHERTEALYRQYKHVFDAMADNVDALGTQIERSAEMNYLRWDVLGSEASKANGTDFSGSYSDALRNLKTWLSGRAEKFSIPETKTVSSVVSDDYRTLSIRYRDEEPQSSLRFVIWNRNSKDSSVMWYDGVDTLEGWNVEADLGSFQEAGLYQISVYTAESEEPIANGINYVAGVGENPYAMEVTVSEDMQSVMVTVNDPNRECSSVNFAIWSTANNQADIQVFNAERTADGQWACTVDLSGYEAEGEYNIHAFGQTSTEYKRLNAETFQKYRVWAKEENPYIITTQLNEDASAVTITMAEPLGDCTLVNFLVWSSDMGQGDLQVFAAKKTSDGKWTCIADLTGYEVEGEYNVHAFGERLGGYVRLNTDVFQVSFSR